MFLTINKQQMCQHHLHFGLNMKVIELFNLMSFSD